MRVLVLLAMLWPVAELNAAFRSSRRFHRQSRAASLTQRKRLTGDRLITEGGFMNLAWNNAFTPDGDYTMPTTIQITPGGDHFLLDHTEYSLSFDGIESLAGDGTRVTHFSDHATAAATMVLLDTKHIDIALAPQVTWLWRNDTGIRAGGTLTARFDIGQHNFGGSIAWSAATQTSPGNPAGLWDAGAGYGREIGKRLIAHSNGTYEKGAGLGGIVIATEGLTVNLSKSLSLDLTGQHFILRPGVNHQVVIGLEWTHRLPGR